jgi:hypothetical protein
MESFHNFLVFSFQLRVNDEKIVKTSGGRILRKFMRNFFSLPTHGRIKKNLKIKEQV